MKRGDLVRIIAQPRSFIAGSDWAGATVTVTDVERGDVIGVVRGDVHWYRAAYRAGDRAHVDLSDLVPTGEVNDEFLSARYTAKVSVPDLPGFPHPAAEFYGLFDTPEECGDWIDAHFGDMPEGRIMSVAVMYPAKRPEEG